jgi:hypothetical protein
MGAVMQGATALRSLREHSNDAFDYDVQQRPWYARVLLVLGASLGVAKSRVQCEPPLYRGFHAWCTVSCCSSSDCCSNCAWHWMVSYVSQSENLQSWCVSETAMVWLHKRTG